MSAHSILPESLEQKYKFGPQLGNGDFGKVLICTERASGDAFALKIVSKREVLHYINPSLEIGILRQLNHPNIVKLCHHEITSTHFFMILELVKGLNLLQTVVLYRSFAEEQVSKMMAQLLLGIDYLHSNNIMHRDINMANVMIEIHDNVEFGKLKIVDFGAACGVIDLQTPFQFTEGFGAPEMSLDEFPIPKYTKAVDIFAAGRVLQCFCNVYIPCNVPLFAEHYYCTFMKKEHQVGWLKVIPSIKRLIRKMVKNNPGDRFTAKDCLAHPWIRKSV